MDAITHNYRTRLSDMRWIVDTSEMKRTIVGDDVSETHIMQA